MVTNAKSDASSAQSSAAGDIWSLALVILELFSGNNITKDTKSSAAADNAALVDRVPWYGLDESAIIDAAVVQRRPPPQLLSAALPEELRALLTHCLAADPSSRPSASEVLSALLALSRMYPALEANDREAFQRYHTEVSTSGITLDRTIQLMQLSGSAAEDFAHAHAEAAEEVECVVCLDALATHQCSPCGHRCVCAGCSILAMATCPFCREPIQKLERVAK
jgi:serine/threonine protein kinase